MSGRVRDDICDKRGSRLVQAGQHITQIDGDALASTWRTWWLGDIGGVLIVAPVLLVAVTNRRRSDRPPGHTVEAALLVIALLVATAASLLPANKAASTTVREALAYE